VGKLEVDLDSHFDMSTFFYPRTRFEGRFVEPH